MQNSELIEGSGQVLAQSQALAVKTPATRKQAADLWDAIRAFRKQAEGRKEEVCRPLKTAWDDAKKPFDAFVKECQGAEATLQKVMGEWDREQDRLARIEQAKIQAKVDAENAKKLAKAEEKGTDLSEVVLKVAPVVQAPPKAIETQAGTTQQRIEKTVYGIKGVVTDTAVRADDPTVAALIAKFPALFELNWVAFRKLASTGMLDNVPNVSKSIEYVYAQRSK
ncbi:MAG: hypothetical protein OEV08_07615 [Nitrospira sp.]|nr:hypothetical protein [Nitrospira sp.]